MQAGRNKEAPLCTSMVCPNETAPTVKLRKTKENMDSKLIKPI